MVNKELQFDISLRKESAWKYFLDCQARLEEASMYLGYYIENRQGRRAEHLALRMKALDSNLPDIFSAHWVLMVISAILANTLCRTSWVQH